MSQVRYRVAALALGGLLLGTPVLAGGTASAEQVEAGDRQVVFGGGGGMLGLSCRSQPSVHRLTVPADSTVRVVNRTGYPALLRMGGATRGTVADDGSAELVFRRGTTSVELAPSCAVSTESTPLMVTAEPDPIEPPPPTFPGDGGGAAPTGPDGPSDTDTPTAAGGGSATPGSTTPDRTQRPSATATRGQLPGGSRTVTPAAAMHTMPQGGGAETRVRTRIFRGTGAAPAFSGMPPGDSRAIVGGTPTDQSPTMSEAAMDPAADSSPTNVAAAEPVAELRAIPQSGPNGLLVVVAIVCALGVGVAAIRAIVSQRASRSSIA